MTEIETHSRARNAARAQREKIEARRSRRHTMADIKFSPKPYVVCTCAWRYDGPDTEDEWKRHKYAVGERHFH